MFNKRFLVYEGKKQPLLENLRLNYLLNWMDKHAGVLY